ncbi:isochorismatase family cysteine hydrolase [Longimicrobium sp.]|uniref:cysteine hydrolase family protein n=1 Tax=Longimicrobium sp. TaxID=2029185 RepID=UPI002E2EF971|nr:isochorismatase family cysteine hydrolase [Longimicrobium sp.]HEX6038409.1 isochorismatase family cysteine hydrolase [Longimicrobium sp.]
MPQLSEDLHGNAPDQSPVALLLIDMINDLEFPGGENVAGPATAAAERIAALKEQARARGIPVIYANDNFGKWRSDFREVVKHCLEDGVRGQRLAELLQPGRDDYFVLKPKHSAFFETTLATLLEYLGARHLILTGITADICVLFTASDAYMREYTVHVPSDCVAGLEEVDTRQALRYMQRVLHADTTPSTQLDLDAMIQEASQAPA